MGNALKVYGLSSADLTALKAVSKQRYGKPNISQLAHDLLSECARSVKTENNETEQMTGEVKSRMELKLPSFVASYLQKLAQNQQMSANRAALSILMEHISCHPVISDNEVQALYQSNYQLLRIGRNLNQIARQLNIGENASITTQHIHELKAVIDAHTERVHQVLKTNRRRFERN